MVPEEWSLSRAKELIEAKLGWGPSSGWTNKDFLELSKKIQSETGASVSHMTLKRIWGKVKYESLPNAYTLSTLVQFIGFENWRDFKTKTGSSATNSVIPKESKEITTEKKPASILQKNARFSPIFFLILVLITVAGLLILFVSGTKKNINPEDYFFSSKQILEAGIPNSVVFDYDATKAPSDSVVIQQSWDSTLRTTVSKDQHQHTLIYYFPGFFKPKLLVNNRIVKEYNLLLKSDGWVAAIGATPVPVYLKKKDVISNGKMSLPVDKITEQHINLSPQAPKVSFINVQDFGEIYSDDFDFETSLKNDYREGSAVCQQTHIYLLCEGTAIGIPLCAKGCTSSLNFFFTNFTVSGKEHDLSCFGVDFNDFVKVKVKSVSGKATIFLNNKFCYQVNQEIGKSKIIGIDFVFEGTGTVDYVRLSNNKVSFDNEF